jgi:hypothetical protein
VGAFVVRTDAGKCGDVLQVQRAEKSHEGSLAVLLLVRCLLNCRDQIRCS